MKISIIIPCYNEEKYIIEVLKNINLQKKKFNLEIIISDDGSNDKTVPLLKKNKKLAGYGASARSSTLLNYCKINNKHLDFVFDKSDMKHNLFTSGSNIKIRNPEIKIIKNVDCILILAWNFKDEIIKFLKKIKFSGILITVLPRIKIFKC